ncbi:hypothetical protein C7M84_001654 [Penaeus vannamei]|uniref:Uncharacterized protein n=1 Tax=Penaeus vannamei TaxID=6689 RepID=A0A423TT37_PENVA|nr:hypothetical protein C7M84_001654 [Penaeus vannamei]
MCYLFEVCQSSALVPFSSTSFRPHFFLLILSIHLFIYHLSTLPTPLLPSVSSTSFRLFTSSSASYSPLPFRFPPHPFACLPPLQPSYSPSSFRFLYIPSLVLPPLQPSYSPSFLPFFPPHPFACLPPLQPSYSPSSLPFSFTSFRLFTSSSAFLFSLLPSVFLSILRLFTSSSALPILPPSFRFPLHPFACLPPLQPSYSPSFLPFSSTSFRLFTSLHPLILPPPSVFFFFLPSFRFVYILFSLPIFSFPSFRFLHILFACLPPLQPPILPPSFPFFLSILSLVYILSAFPILLPPFPFSSTSFRLFTSSSAFLFSPPPPSFRFPFHPFACLPPLQPSYSPPPSVFLHILSLVYLLSTLLILTPSFRFPSIPFAVPPLQPSYSPSFLPFSSTSFRLFTSSSFSPFLLSSSIRLLAFLFSLLPSVFLSILSLVYLLSTLLILPPSFRFPFHPFVHTFSFRFPPSRHLLLTLGS